MWHKIGKSSLEVSNEKYLTAHYNSGIAIIDRGLLGPSFLV